MFPIFFVIGLINILAKHSNYGINITDPNFDVRVRRSIQETDIREGDNRDINNNIEHLKSDISREKRYAYYNKIKITNHDAPGYNYSNGNSTRNGYNFVTQSNGSRSHINGNNTLMNNTVTRNNGNRYNIFNSTWNYLFNTNRRYVNGNQNSKVNNNTGYDSFHGNNGIPRLNINNTFSRSYPYGYPTGYGPQSTGYKSVAPATPGYTNASNQPYFYNYQYPSRQNFGGYFGFNASLPGYNNTPRWDNNFNNLPAPYNSGYTQNPVNQPGTNNNNNGSVSSDNFNNILAPFSPRYATKPGNYTGFNNDNLEPRDNPYAPGYNPKPANNAGYFAYNNTTPVYNNFQNILASYAPKPGNSTSNNLYPYAPGYIPNPGNNTATEYNFNLATTNAPGYNRSVTPGYAFGNGNPDINVETTTVVLSGCLICNIPCPAFMNRLGMICVPDKEDDY